MGAKMDIYIYDCSESESEFRLIYTLYCRQRMAEVTALVTLCKR